MEQYYDAVAFREPDHPSRESDHRNGSKTVNTQQERPGVRFGAQESRADAATMASRQGQQQQKQPSPKVERPQLRPSLSRASTYNPAVARHRNDTDSSDGAETQSLDSDDISDAIIPDFPIPDAMIPDLAMTHLRPAPQFRGWMYSSSDQGAQVEAKATEPIQAQANTSELEMHDMSENSCDSVPDNPSKKKRAMNLGAGLSSGHSEGRLYSQHPQEEDRRPEEEIAPVTPSQVSPGISTPVNLGSSRASSPRTTTPATETANPKRRKWYEQKRRARSMEMITGLVGSTVSRLTKPSNRSAPLLTNPGSWGRRSSPDEEHRAPEEAHPEPEEEHSEPGGENSEPGEEHPMPEEAPAAAHGIDTLTRQKYIVHLCRAFMGCGVPSHRLEEHLRSTASYLGIHAQFMYVPDCMHISFDDIITHTSEVKFVRSSQAVNLYKLKLVHEIYKEVMHDCIDVNTALDRLDQLMKAKNMYPVWGCVLMYGLASGAISFLFKSRFIDIPVVVGLGMILGYLHLITAASSRTYNTVFEFGSTILITFLARGIASIKGGELFCFSAIAQGSIAIILPGYLMLTAALELQSKAIVPGSIRLVYSILYLMFLTYGVTVGTALYGALDSDAVTEMVCKNPPSPHFAYLFVALFTILISATFQAKWSQMPAMIVVSVIGYMINSYTSQRFASNPAIGSTCSSFVIGALAILHSRISHGVAVIAVLPAVYVLVPSGLASSGAITSGLMAAANFKLDNPTMPNPNDTRRQNTFVFDVAANMLQVGLGMTAGLFLSAWFIYPKGKLRGGLWNL